MSLLGSALGNQYQQFVFGTWGNFNTAAGKVAYLETKARLTNVTDTSPESRLTPYLNPVREALPVAEMNFNQLLQRDLDDHRVAIELVPYLLDPAKTGPAFFPPIVACLLPFQNGAPLPHFAPASAPTPLKDDIAEWTAIEYGAAFRVDRLMATASQEHQAKLGRLSWNPELAQLVVIDGQHRAMALLAIDRTVNGRWKGSAEKYRSFYEPVVNRCMDKLDAAQRAALFSDVELPVTIAWFPDLPPHMTYPQAARKVFVDLNKNARPPSPSRLMLLSDSDLYSIFTRQLLNDMRAGGGGLPIYAVEYDNPSRDQASSAKWSTITNIASLFECVKRLVAGPQKYFTDMRSAFVGRDNEGHMRTLLRQSLALSEVLQETVEDDRVYVRDEIDAYTFPPSCVPALEQQFANGWGYLLQHVFAELSPYRVHAESLIKLRDSWVPHGNPAAALAKDSIFEGVGLYWTLRESEIHWRSENQRRRDEQNLPPMPHTDVIDAWYGTLDKRTEFTELRAKAYAPKAKENEVNSAFDSFSTVACQLGLVLACRAVAQANGVDYPSIRKFANAIVEATNAGLLGRELFLARDNSRGINQLPKLDTPFAVHFRYFWLELFSVAAAREVLGKHGLNSDISPLVGSAREHYRSFLLKITVRNLKAANPNRSEDHYVQQARKEVDSRLRNALKRSFGIDEQAYEKWVQSVGSASQNVKNDEEPEAEEIGESNQAETTLDYTDDPDGSLERLEQALDSRTPSHETTVSTKESD
jgi:hypothetical protein